MLVIAHFYNEEYLLPFWLNHHKNLFDHGILIDSFSNDNSVNIINKYAPTWTVIKSPTKKFNSEIMENFIMKLENEYSSETKIVLNISEFLIIKKNDKFQKLLTKEKHKWWVQTALMVDIQKEKRLIKDLINEKETGFWHTDINVYKIDKKFFFGNSIYRERLLHNYPNGEYFPGRHKSKLENIKRMPKNIAYLRWYNYSPWNADFINRKLSFAETLSQNDIDKNHGTQHLAKYDELEKLYSHYSKLSYPISKIRVKSYFLSFYHLKIYPFSFFFKKLLKKN